MYLFFLIIIRFFLHQPIYSFYYSMHKSFKVKLSKSKYFTKYSLKKQNILRNILFFKSKFVRLKYKIVNYAISYHITFITFYIECYKEFVYLKKLVPCKKLKLIFKSSKRFYLYKKKYVHHLIISLKSCNYCI